MMVSAASARGVWRGATQTRYLSTPLGSIESKYRPQLGEKAPSPMRQPIDTAPRDGNDVILEDDAAGTYDVAHWSAEAGNWISESGEPSRITPSHWHPMPIDRHLEAAS